MHNEIKNFKNMIDSLDFMIRKYDNNEVITNYGFSEPAMIHGETGYFIQMRKDKCELCDNTYIYDNRPSVHSSFNHHTRLSSINTYTLGKELDTYKKNVIVFDAGALEWLIRVESDSSEFEYIRKNIVYQNKDHIRFDINDEADIFQKSLLVDIEPHLLEIAKMAMPIVSISPLIDKVLLKSTMPIVDLGIVNFKELQNKE